MLRFAFLDFDLGDGTVAGNKKEKLWTKEYIISLGIVFGVNLTMEMLHSTLAIYGKGLTHSDVYAGMLVTAFTIAALTSRGFMGAMFKRWSIKAVLLIGTVISVAASFGYLLFQDPMLFVACRVLHGIGFGVASTAAATAISVSLPKSRMLEGIGYSGMVSTVTMAIGPSISLSISHSDYLLFDRVFWVTAILMVISLVAALLVKINPTEQDEGEEKIKRVGAGNLLSKVVLVTTILQFLMAFAQTAITAFLGLYALEKDLGNVSVFFACYAVASFAIRLVMPYLVDKFSERKVMLVSIVAAALCFGVIPLIENIWIICALAIPYGCACGLISPIFNVRILREVPLSKHGSANAIWYAAIDAGIGIGAFVWSGIATVTGYDVVYLIAAVMAVCCFLVECVFKVKER